MSFPDRDNPDNVDAYKGQQKVTVEHVHINKGGQAIVGAVNQEGGGGGGNL